MKGCVVITRESGIILHEFAAKLNEAYGVDSFCAFAQSGNLIKSILQSRRGLYTKVLNQENLYEKAGREPLDKQVLDSLEKKYGSPTLWPYLLGEKTIMLTSPAKVFFSYDPACTHEEMLKILCVFFGEIEKFLREEKPDFLLTAGIGSLGTYVIYAVAKKLGIKTIDMQVARIGNRFLLTEDFRCFTGVEKIFEKIRAKKYASPFSKEAKKFLTEFRRNPRPYFPIFIQFGNKARLKFLVLHNIIRTLKMVLELAKIKLFRTLPAGQKSIPPFRFFVELIWKKIRGLAALSLCQKPAAGEEYAFFPLQMEPEVGNSILSPVYANYIETARLAAKSLPVRFKLYVKEHPAMRGIRKLSYYRKILQIPNVRLIDDTLSGHSMISSARIVLTNVSTVGWEAILLKKPVITFGNIFYNKLSWVQKCEDPEKLPDLVQKALNFEVRSDDQELLDFLAAIMEDSVPFDFAGIMDKRCSDQEAPQIVRSSEGFEDLARLIAAKIKKD